MERNERPALRIIGIGNSYRKDDSVGLVVAQQIKERIRRRPIEVLEHSGEGVALMESWNGAATVILVDATRSGTMPGTIRRIDCNGQPLPRSMFCDSTHAFGVAEAIELGRALNRLPQQLILYGIEGGDFTAGTELSPAVERAVPQAVNSVLKEAGSPVV